MNRFDYVKYDEQAMSAQLAFKDQFMALEEAVNIKLNSPRAKALVMTKLEEAYMWVGKAIRDDQLARNELETSLNEQRGNS